MQLPTMMPQCSVAEPLKLVQLVIVESLQVLT